jgi:hypothetical protein
MRTVKYCLLAALAFGVLGLGAYQAKEEKEKPKYSIKEVMELAHSDDGLREKVIEGTANKGDKEKLLEAYVALSHNKPPKGDAGEWKKMTQACIMAARDSLAGKEGAVAELKKATNCKECHMRFRIPPKK